MYTPGAMSLDDWNSCKVLKLSTRHNWGNPSQIDRRVIKTLDAFAVSLKTQVLVTCGTNGTHVDGSFHYPTNERLGLALDFMLPDIKRSELPSILLHLLRYPFTGIGIYSDWRLTGSMSPQGGFHVDLRPQEVKALWLRDEKEYLSLSLENLSKYFI